ncbi:MAG: 3'-5' exonuclease [Neisseria sp.]|nr:3'-5' exonuclease [Neisseria sp.]
MSLNPQQSAAVTYLDGPLLVLAGAGSGKTRVITEKIAYLINHAGFAPHQIAAITFTNKAAQEMRERAGALLSGKASRGLVISTFHSLGMQIVREEAEALGLKKRFSIFDGSDAGKILSELIGSSGREEVFRAQHAISLWKNALLTPEEVFQAASDDWESRMAQIYASYSETLRAYHAVDFDDLINLPCRLFSQFSDIKYKWQMRLRHLLIDECQDTNACQYALMNHLVGSEARFTAVGDDDQSIYAWRGAEVENLRRLHQDYPRLHVIKLEQNYRSTRRILRVANAVIAHNPQFFEKKLWSQHEEGEPIAVLSCKDEQHEAEVVINKIRMHRLNNQLRFADYAILYRGNHQARVFEEALRSAKMPYVLSGGQSFFDKAEIKDVLAYVRLLANPDDDPAFLRAVTTPKRGIGEATLGKLNELAQAQHESLYAAASRSGALSVLPAAARGALEAWLQWLAQYRRRAENEAAGSVMQSLLQDIAYEQYLLENNEGKSGEIRWHNVQDLAAWLHKKGAEDGKNLIDIAQTIALMTLLDGKSKEDPDAVKLSTLHAAKGLEYPHVFLVGCEEGLFPHENSIEEGNLEEERRLMYVGITRAQQALTLTHSRKRRRAGHWQFAEPSRFLEEMPTEDVRFYGRKDDAPIISREEGNAQLEAMLNMLKNKKK